MSRNTQREGFGRLLDNPGAGIIMRLLKEDVVGKSNSKTLGVTAKLTAAQCTIR